MYAINKPMSVGVEEFKKYSCGVITLLMRTDLCDIGI